MRSIAKWGCQVAIKEVNELLIGAESFRAALERLRKLAKHKSRIRGGDRRSIGSKKFRKSADFEPCMRTPAWK